MHHWLVQSLNKVLSERGKISGETNNSNDLLFVRRTIAFKYDLMRSLRKHQFLKSSELKTAYFYGKTREFVGIKVCIWRYALKFNTDVCMVRTRMHSFVPFFIAKETNTCILGRMYFIERSIYFKSIHLTINNFTGAQVLGVFIDRLLRQCCFVSSKL